jgi:hypothetical protein
VRCRSDYEKGPLTWENGACDSSRISDQEGTFSMQSSHTLEQLDICFDDTHAIANAGLLLPATLAERLSMEQTADEFLLVMADQEGKDDGASLSRASAAEAP